MTRRQVVVCNCRNYSQDIAQIERSGLHMDDRSRMDENGTLYLDFTEQEQPEEILEIETSNGLLYYLFMAAVGIIVIFGILAVLFFGFLFLLLLPLFFGLLLVFLIARYFFWRSSSRY